MSAFTTASPEPTISAVNRSFDLAVVGAGERRSCARAGPFPAMIRSLSIRLALFCTAILLYVLAGVAIADRQLTERAVQVAAAISAPRYPCGRGEETRPAPRCP